jgi:hypothetical protein
MPPKLDSVILAFVSFIVETLSTDTMKATFSSNRVCMGFCSKAADTLYYKEIMSLLYNKFCVLLTCSGLHLQYATSKDPKTQASCRHLIGSLKGQAHENQTTLVRFYVLWDICMTLRVCG